MNTVGLIFTCVTSVFFARAHIIIVLYPRSDTPTPLPIHHVPVPLTCGVFDGTIVTDPSLLEEDLVTTHVTIVSTATGQVTRVALCCCLLQRTRTALGDPKGLASLLAGVAKSRPRFGYPYNVYKCTLAGLILDCLSSSEACNLICWYFFGQCARLTNGSVVPCFISGVRGPQTWWQLCVRRATQHVSAALPTTCSAIITNAEGSC